MTFVTRRQEFIEQARILRRVLFLKGLPLEVLQDLAESGLVRQLQKGEMIVGENDRCIGLVVVLTGAVRVYKLDSRGRELTLDREEAGDSVMEMPLFDGGNYPANAEAAEQDTRILVIGSGRMHTLLQEHPEVALLGLKALGVRTRKLITMVEAQSLYPVRSRLAAYLKARAVGNATFTLPETNEAIGSQIGTVREVVSRTLHSFKEIGAINLRGRTVTIVDPDLLQRIEDGDDRRAN